MSAVKCLIWGTGVIYNKYFNVIKYHEMIKNIEIVGVTSNTSVFTNILGYSYVNIKSVKDTVFDVIVVMTDDNLFKEIKQEAINLGIKKDRIISYKALTLPKVNLKKYVEIVKNTPTIFANNCWGGIVYNKLGLEFRSPLINMFERDEDYIKFLENPQKYINTPLTLKEELYSQELNINFPVCQCDDILLYFNHYKSFEEADDCWVRRKRRINWDNLFIMMYTENKDIALKFSELPYKKKICFVPFQTDKKSLFYVDFRNKKEASKLPFWNIVNSMVYGAYGCYDVLELLYSGNIVRTAE